VSLLARYQGSDQQEKRDKHIKRIKSSVNNLTQILNDFLSISKLEEGKTSLHLAGFQLEAIAQQAIEDIEPVLRPGQRIYFRHSGESSLFYSEPHLIKNILINLLSNAIKYSPENQPIDVRSFQHGNHLKIEVSDKGIGIPENEQHRLFNRFFRAENAINIQGTGLGLHIVKKYVDLLRGEISFNSKLEAGTTFTVILPSTNP
jgi:signal transduction histidine kinase